MRHGAERGVTFNNTAETARAHRGKLGNHKGNAKGTTGSSRILCHRNIQIGIVNFHRTVRSSDRYHNDRKKLYFQLVSFVFSSKTFVQGVFWKNGLSLSQKHNFQQFLTYR